jgi:hypothetical protein
MTPDIIKAEHLAREARRLFEQEPLLDEVIKLAEERDMEELLSLKARVPWEELPARQQALIDKINVRRQLKLDLRTLMVTSDQMLRGGLKVA